MGKGEVMINPMSPLTERLQEVIHPLDDEEAGRAVAAALAHRHLRRPHVYGAELRIEKRPRPVPHRQVSVLLADLDGYTVHEVIVDQPGSVVESIDHAELVPPFSSQEIEEATVLARSYPALADLARRWQIKATTFYPSAHDQEQGSQRRRRIGVHFLDCADPASIAPVVSVIVDLTNRTVESLVHHEEQGT